MSETYKKFTAQDYAIVPFNAHKQYSYGSSSAASNSVTHYPTRWTSESISLYSSASTNPQGVFDSINTIKYSQIDHLFYKDFLTNHANLFGDFHYQYHKRNLYEKANILSIPEGLYGEEIKPGSFYLSSSNYVIVDDKYGNLILNNADTHNYPTDLRANVFRLDPIKGFKHYDLNLFNDYAIKLIDPQHPEAGTYKAFWKKGKINPNAPKTYSTHGDLQERDDSYFMNTFKYKSVNFSTSSLGDDNHKFSSINFNSITGSQILVHHDERFNFNTKENFAISFNMQPNTLSYGGGGVPLTTKHKFQGGYIFNISEGIGSVAIEEDFVIDQYPNKNGDYAYIVKPELQTNLGSNIVKNGTFNTDSDWTKGTGWTISGGTANCDGTQTSPSNLTSTTNLSLGTGKVFQITFDISNYSAGTLNHVTLIGTGGAEIANINSNGSYTAVSHGPSSTNNKILIKADANFVGSIDNISVKEISFFDQSFLRTSTAGIGGGEPTTDDMADTKEFLANKVNEIKSGYDGWWLPNKDELNEILTVLKPYKNDNFIGINSDGKSTKSLNTTENQLVVSEQIDALNYQVWNEASSTYTSAAKDSPTIFQYLLVRKVNIKELDSYRRDIIGKSTTKTVIPSAMEGRSEILNTNVSGNMQPMNIPAESQFPFEIYMKSNTIYFDRADSYKQESINYSLPNNNGEATGSSHVFCQYSASKMEIYVNGELKAERSATLTKPTRNRANLYIGSKGTISKSDSNFTNNSFRNFNGNLSNINIWENGFNATEIARISESINASPYIGNIFYKNGFVAITHPNYYSILGSIGIGDMAIESDFAIDSDKNTGISKLEFQGTHKITEWEYQCTIDEYEYNATTNISARKSMSNNKYELASFTTSSVFKPYITTIGLYDEHNNLLVVGKLNQPVKTSNKMDTTFIVRWDT